MAANASGQGTKIFKSACRMCHGGCGLLVHVQNGKVIKLEGDPDSPVSRGKICPKGLASIELMYHPDRITHPMKRVGERGRGKWERITWEEAYGILVPKIRELQEKYGNETIAVAHGTGRYYFNHVIRFAHALGTPNWIEPGTAQCFIPRIISSLITYGDLIVTDYGYGEDGKTPECLLCWGKHPYVSGPDAESQFRVKHALQRGTKLIVVDPRQTRMAEMADIWLRVRPSTDDALALGFMHVIINEGLYDKEFVEKWTVGFESLKERVQQYSPERVEEITWVPAEQIRSAARMYATIKPAAMTWGNALEHSTNAFQTGRAVGLLPALTGNIDVPGGNVFGPHLVDEIPLWLLDKLSEETKNKRMGADTYRILCSKEAIIPSANIPLLFKAMRTGKPYPVKGLLLCGNNGLVSFANAKLTHETLTCLDFIAAIDLFMTPTAALADLFLPSATWLEADEILSAPLIAGNFILAQQKIVQVEECKQPEQIFIEIARRMQLPHATESLEELLNESLKPVGLTFAQLKERGYHTVPWQYRKHETNGIGFVTPSGKVELYCSYAEMLGYDPLPHYVEAPETPYSLPELAGEFPYVLSTGGRIQQYFNGEFRQIHGLRKQHPYPLVEMSHHTAERHGIRDGDWVWIETPRGRIKQKAKLTDQDDRVVHVSYGWWYPEMPGPEYGIWESNANVLTNDEPPHCPAIGTYQLTGLLCKIYKVRADEETPESWREKETTQ